MDNVYFKVESFENDGTLKFSIYDRPTGVENLVLDGSKLNGIATNSIVDLSKDIYLDIADKNDSTYNQLLIDGSIIPNSINRLSVTLNPEGTNMPMEDGSAYLPWASGGSGRSNQKTSAVLSSTPTGLELIASGGNDDGPSGYTLNTTLNDLLAVGELGLPMEEQVGPFGTNFKEKGYTLYISCIANQNGSYTFTFMLRPDIEKVEELRENLIVSKDDVVLNKVNLKPLTETLIEKAELSYKSFELTPHQNANDTSYYLNVVFYDENDNVLGVSNNYNENASVLSSTFTLPDGCAYFTIQYLEERSRDEDAYGHKRFDVADLSVGNSVLSDMPTTYGRML